MASFTMYLWEVIELGGNNRDKALGLDDYPIFDEAYRKTLNDNIVNNYYNDEIGHETVSLFHQSMRSRMHLLMPYYNGLYESQQVLFDTPILSAIDLTNAGESSSGTTQTNTSASETQTDAQNSSEARQYNYPQQQLRSNGEYMSGASQTDGDSTSTGTASETANGVVESSGESATHSTGRNQTAAALVTEFRQALMGIDQQIVSELEDMFMGIWTNGEAFTNHNSGYMPYYTPYYR